MRIDRLSDNFSKLEKSQMLKIDELQEKIKLYEFDRTNDHKIISELKRKIKYRNEAINSAIKELEINNVKMAKSILKWISKE